MVESGPQLSFDEVLDDSSRDNDNDRKEIPPASKPKIKEEPEINKRPTKTVRDPSDGSTYEVPI